MKPAEEEPIFINVASFSMSSAVLSMKFSYDEKMRKSILIFKVVSTRKYPLSAFPIALPGSN